MLAYNGVTSVCVCGCRYMCLPIVVLPVCVWVGAGTSVCGVCVQVHVLAYSGVTSVCVCGAGTCSGVTSVCVQVPVLAYSVLPVCVCVCRYMYNAEADRFILLCGLDEAISCSGIHDMASGLSTHTHRER